MHAPVFSSANLLERDADNHLRDPFVGGAAGYRSADAEIEVEAFLFDVDDAVKRVVLLVERGNMMDTAKIGVMLDTDLYSLFDCARDLDRRRE
jgi:hypothetical protein